MERGKARMRVKQPLLWVAGIFAIVFFVIFLGWEEIALALHRADSKTMASLALLQVATLGMTAYQWHFLLRKMGQQLTFFRVFGIYLAGGFVESVTPSVKLGGEAAKLYLFRRSTSLSHRQLAGAFLAHKYISLFPFVILCAPFITIAALRREIPVLAYLSFAALGIFWGLIFWLLHRRPQDDLSQNKPPERAQNLDGSLSFFRSNKILSLAADKLNKLISFLNDAARHSRLLTISAERGGLLFISFLVWGLYPVKVYLVTSMLGYEVAFGAVALATYTAYLVSMLPLFPGGLGTFEGTMALMLSLGGISPAEGLAAALLTRSITYWFPLFLSAGVTAGLLWKYTDCYFRCYQHQR